MSQSNLQAKMMDELARGSSKWKQIEVMTLLYGWTPWDGSCDSPFAQLPATLLFLVVHL